MDAYATGRYEEAADWLRRSVEAGGKNGEVAFYLGVSLLMIEDAEGAEAALRTAIQRTPSSPLYRWYLAQALLVQERAGAAEAELNRIVESGGEYAREAQNLLRRLAEIKG
jgi:Flp pilus assembly protein TadD